MKKVLFIAVMLFVMAGVVSAQVPTPFSLYVGGAVSIPNSPDAFADLYKTGFHGSVGFGLKVMPGLQTVAKVEFHRFKLDHEATQAINPLLVGEDINGGHNNMWMFGADLRYTLPIPQPAFKPFIIGGLGLARISVTDFDGTSSLVASLNDLQPETQNKVYFNVGAGFEFPTGPKMNLFAQVRYVSIATEGESSSFIPITIGLKFF